MLVTTKIDCEALLSATDRSRYHYAHFLGDHRLIALVVR
jgi:hypothetical protein